MNIYTPQDGTISIDDNKGFVSSSAAAAGKDKAEAYQIEGPENYVIGVDAGTPIAPEFRDSSGQPLDGSTRITLQKCDRQGNPIGSGILFTELLSRFDFEKMRNDPDYFRRIDDGVMIDEYEIVKLFVDIPAGANDFAPAQSTLTIGDETSDYGKPVEIVSHEDLSGQESAAVKTAARGGN